MKDKIEAADRGLTKCMVCRGKIKIDDSGRDERNLGKSCVEIGKEVKSSSTFLPGVRCAGLTETSRR